MLGTSPGAGDLTARTRYDADGNIVDTRMPASDGNDAGTKTATYYTAADSNVLPGCGNKPQWAGLLCQSGPKTQPPGSPITTSATTYNYWGEVDTVTETSGGTTRVSSSGYDSAARPTTSSVSVTPTAAGGTPIPTVTTNYDAFTGDATSITDGITSITRESNGLGQLTSYTDAGGSTSTYSYDVDSRVAAANDGRGSYAYTYDGTDSAGRVERRGFVTSLDANLGSGLSVFTGAYDAAGQLTTQNLPNGLTVT